jgi:raffinose/stachyose/melibiose transport system substrate-binding protein
MTGVGATWSINANSAHPQEAAEYLTWAYSPEAQAQRFNNCGFALAPVHIEADAFSQADPRTARIYTAYAEAAAAGHYGYTTWTFFPNDMGVAVNDDIQRVLQGSMTPEEYMQNLQDLYTQAVADGTVPPLPAR